MNNGYNFYGPGFRGSPNFFIRQPIVSHTASKISFSEILNGASKTLGVINQAIPVFYQIRPIWNNTKTMFKVIRGINSVDNNFSNVKKKDTFSSTVKKEQINAPVFFD